MGRAHEAEKNLGMVQEGFMDRIDELVRRCVEAESSLAAAVARAERMEKVLDGVREEIHDKPTGLVHRDAFDQACSDRDAARARVRAAEAIMDKLECYVTIGEVREALRAALAGRKEQKCVSID
jgi:hypothetical protein